MYIISFGEQETYLNIKLIAGGPIPGLDVF